jgi:opacity protein-like surface antigen
MRAKVFLLALALVSASTILIAQDEGSKFQFGLKVAPTFAWITSDDFETAGGQIGFAYGLIGDYHFTKNYALGTGIDVTYRGGKIESASVNTSTGEVTKEDIGYSLQYIELPVTMKLMTNEIGYITYYGQFGFAPGVNIRAKADGESFKSDVSPFNLALLVGLGAEYSLGGRTALTGGIKFNNGFLDFVKEKEVKGTSSFIALEVGVMF